MKKSIALLCFALSIGAGSAAQAANNGDAVCTQLSSSIAARSALFAKVAGTAPELSASTQSATAAVLQDVHNKEAALQNVANEIWSLRTQMAYFDCAQAKTFTY
jgi:Skp family chaperone for outer membrane proteins